MKKKFLIIMLLMPWLVFAKDYKIMEFEYSDAYKNWIDNKDKNSFFQPVKYKFNNVANINIGADITQSRYNLKDDNLVPPVRNQGKTESCWAFTSSDAIHSNYLKTHTGDATLINKLFSPVHIELMANNNNITGLDLLNRLPVNRSLNAGGNYFITSSYLLTLKGPVYENDNLKLDDYSKLLKDNGISNDVVPSASANDLNMNVIKDLKPSVQVNNISLYYDAINNGLCTENVKNVLKDAIVNKGALATNMYIGAEYFGGTNNQYYYYDGTESPNHGVLITGWDDNIEINNFNLNHLPSSKGAWIAKNSYGNAFGDDGYFYISYNDSRICNAVFSFYDVSDNVSDNVYYYDEFVPEAGGALNTNTSVFFANKFKRNTSNTQKERIDSVSMFMPSVRTQYNVYYSSTGELNKLTKIASGVSTSNGYHSIPIETGKQVILNDSASEYYAIVYEYVPEGLTKYDISLFGPSSTPFFVNSTTTDNVSFYAMQSPILENWNPVTADGGTVLNNTIKVYTSFVDDTETSVLDPETTFLLNNGNNNGDNTGTGNNDSGTGDTNNDNTGTGNDTNNNTPNNDNNNGNNTNNETPSTNNNNNTSNSNNNANNTNNDSNVEIVDKDKVNTIQFVNNPLNEEKDSSKLDAKKDIADDNIKGKDYGTIENPHTGAIISIVIITVAIITLTILYRLERNKIIYKI